MDEVDKEVTKVKKLAKEVNEGLVLVYIYIVMIEEVMTQSRLMS